jgi:Protein of unknown function (DUF3618)
MTSGEQEHRVAGDAAEELRWEIEQTRDQLGDTVEQLVAKTDVKKQAKRKATEATEHVKSTASQVAGQATEKAAAIGSTLASGTAQTRMRAQAASEVGKARLEAGKARLQDRAAELGTPGPDASVERVRRAAIQGVKGAQQRQVPLAAVAGSIVAGYLALRWWRNR